jgi:hypothetical protein
MFEVVMMSDPRGEATSPEALEAALTPQGAQALQDPALEFPPRLTDLRTQWAGDTTEG